MKASVVKHSDTSFKIRLEHDGYEFKMGYDFAREWDANWLARKLNQGINEDILHAVNAAVVEATDKVAE